MTQIKRKVSHQETLATNAQIIKSQPPGNVSHECTNNKKPATNVQMINSHQCLLNFVKLSHIYFMDNAIAYKNLVALSNSVHLRFFTNWNRYERWQICFRSDCGVSPETLLRAAGNKTQRPYSWNGTLLLESYVGYHVRSTHRLP